ncbi:MULTISPECIES: type VII secretion integral membrane protein EccD [Nocardiopsis]|uniref:Secretion protein snm4 n=1 Tax=Nocardiopsis dassonvillei (strain ATCC 23218 / DSM 43111 / CIP 107115 / JCM 7437 / KCTC 9190 / NBRC 14626 / NCTC 10488 / NRRL B-5397 / IMRU 509) TaxID=446468 RepID=D7AZ23_NOCDD|nr:MULTISPECIES: type VII secretion integral membrane protein EccD [Nocardiopsis]ADH70003.1 secretion protein snm4 [Nocardiopsis dassonvillei subsp. dassonvillei DSM 43111]APC37989.1 type VII secretion integral membrane protein EccD [Nocardiopsis dassonvillei]NKY78490.1 type VII secretion integral membrane protein EccD [Nocardiopsis dassonvillei]VEI90517.1 type VII secretion integral membrane protein EccD [Nocardiopsis dassonvillei]
MTAWSRVTLVGEERRVDAVLPASEPVGALMPEVLDLLGDQVENPAKLRHLVTASGIVLEGDTTLAERQITDGAVLRLVRAEEPVPAPVVHEVPEAVSMALDDHQGRWNPVAARWTATVSLVALAVGAAWIVQGYFSGNGGLVGLAVVAAVLVAVGASIGPTWREPLGTALAISGTAVGGLVLWLACDQLGWPEWARWGGGAALVAGLVLLLGLTSGLGRGGLTGGGVGLALAVVWSVGAALGLPTYQIAVIMAVACVVLLSLLLRLALMFSGLAVLDDRRSSGEAVTRSDVLTSVAGAHRSLVIATIAVAVSAATAGIGLATHFDWWTAGLSVVLALVVASRARLFPLVAQKSVLIAASLVVLVAFLLSWAEAVPWGVWPALGIAVAVSAVPAVVLSIEQPEHVRARLRGVTSRFEAVAVVVLVPLAIGAFGTFQRLLTTF